MDLDDDYVTAEAGTEAAAEAGTEAAELQLYVHSSCRDAAAAGHTFVALQTQHQAMNRAYIRSSCVVCLTRLAITIFSCYYSQDTVTVLSITSRYACS